MRIGGVYVGFHLRSEANSLRNIHPLYYGASDDSYAASCGFLDERGTNWYDFCYSDEFATAFSCGGRSIYDNCYAYWYSKRGKQHTAFRSPGKSLSLVLNPHIGFGANNATENNCVLVAGEAGGSGRIQNLFVRDTRFITDDAHLPYVKE